MLVMELLGKSLDSYFQSNNKRFSLKTVCMLGIQMVRRIEWVHNRNIIHRDIKPDNFVMGLNNKSHIVYILDFGLSKKYYSVQSGKHIKFKINKKLTGTARYASVNALRGGEHSRKDDMEAIGYVLVYFLKGELPWMGLRMNKKDDKYKVIYEKKRDTSPEELCKGCPIEFEEYVRYTRKLEFEEKPDYRYLEGLFRKVMEREGMECDWFFDWMERKPEIKEEEVKEDEGLEEGERDMRKGNDGRRILTERNEEEEKGGLDIPEENEMNKESGKGKKKKKKGCILV